MKRINSLLDDLQKRFFSSAYQIQRIIVLAAIALGLLLVSFGGYYYYDRYYSSQPKVLEVTIEKAESAVRENPNDPAARLNLAETYMVYKRFDEAAQQAQVVMSAYPDEQRAWFVFGVANALNNNPQVAVEPLERYVNANKDSEFAGLNKSLKAAAYYLGDCYLKLNQPDKAVSTLELLYNWDTMDADAMYKLGVAYTAVQNYDKALFMLHQATSFVPNFKECYQQMLTIFEATDEPALADYASGMIAYSDKQYPQALELLLKSVAAKPDTAPTFSGLGLVYEALEDLPNAKTSYETAIKLDQNDFTAQNGLKRVEILLNK